jgi:hypothetical protein
LTFVAGSIGAKRRRTYVNVEWRIGSTHAFGAIGPKIAFRKLSSPFFQTTDLKTIKLYDVMLLQIKIKIIIQIIKKTYMKNLTNKIPPHSRHISSDHSPCASFLFFLSNLEIVSHLNRLNSTNCRQKGDTNEMWNKKVEKQDLLILHTNLSTLKAIN